jgi:DNA-binding NtrC family response regulator
MKERIQALLVQTGYDPCGALPRALGRQSIEVLNAATCAEAARALRSDHPPHLVFTEVHLADGNWADVLELAAKASASVNLIVLAPFVDVGFYVETIERGAFDFIVAPHSDPELAHVIRTAADNAITNRNKAIVPPPRAIAASAHPAAENWGKS